MKEPTATDESHLCTSCGLCCEGALHKDGDLDCDEVEHLRSIGLKIASLDPPKFALPCPLLVNKCCTRYDERPRACRAYKCQVLLDLESGAHSGAEAHALVATALALREKVRLAGDDTPERRLHTISLAYFLDRHFMNARDLPILAADR